MRIKAQRVSGMASLRHSLRLLAPFLLYASFYAAIGYCYLSGMRWAAWAILGVFILTVRALNGVSRYRERVQRERAEAQDFEDDVKAR